VDRWLVRAGTGVAASEGCLSVGRGTFLTVQQGCVVGVAGLFITRELSLWPTQAARLASEYPPPVLQKNHLPGGYVAYPDCICQIARDEFSAHRVGKFHTAFHIHRCCQAGLAITQTPMSSGTATAQHHELRHSNSAAPATAQHLSSKMDSCRSCFVDCGCAPVPHSWQYRPSPSRSVHNVTIERWSPAAILSQ